MRARVRKGSRLDYKTTDLGGGFYVERERNGSCVWYFAAHLKSPGGFVAKPGRFKRFSYHRDAVSQCETWRLEDEKEQATCKAQTNNGTI